LFEFIRGEGAAPTKTKAATCRSHKCLAEPDPALIKNEPFGLFFYGALRRQKQLVRQLESWVVM